jgi:hypothetical protein
MLSPSKNIGGRSRRYIQVLTENPGKDAPHLRGEDGHNPRNIIGSCRMAARCLSWTTIANQTFVTLDESPSSQCRSRCRAAPERSIVSTGGRSSPETSREDSRNNVSHADPTVRHLNQAVIWREQGGTLCVAWRRRKCHSARSLSTLNRRLGNPAHPDALPTIVRQMQ